jgi:predicted P-loop ATPase/GTPase
MKKIINQKRRIMKKNNHNLYSLLNENLLEKYNSPEYYDPDVIFDYIRETKDLFNKISFEDIELISSMSPDIMNESVYYLINRNDALANCNKLAEILNYLLNTGAIEKDHVKKIIDETEKFDNCVVIQNIFLE